MSERFSARPSIRPTHCPSARPKPDCPILYAAGRPQCDRSKNRKTRSSKRPTCRSFDQLISSDDMNFHNKLPRHNLQLHSLYIFEKYWFCPVLLIFCIFLFLPLELIRSDGRSVSTSAWRPTNRNATDRNRRNTRSPKRPTCRSFYQLILQMI